MKRNILITGGAGFIGSHVVRLFVNKYPDYRIVNLDKLTYAGNLANLRDIENAPNYTFVKADICDYDTIREVFCKYDIDGVIHLAAESGSPPPAGAGIPDRSDGQHLRRHRTGGRAGRRLHRPRTVPFHADQTQPESRTRTRRLPHDYGVLPQCRHRAARRRYRGHHGSRRGKYSRNGSDRNSALGRTAASGKHPRRNSTNN